MKVAVVIPVRNMVDTLERAIRSAVDADEIVVVDDASTDGSFQLALDATQWYKQVSVMGTSAAMVAGVCHARNLGITETECDLIVPLDADDELLPGGLKALVEAYEPGCFVYGNAYDPVANRTLPAAPIGTIARKNIMQATFLFAKDDWLRVGGYDPRFNIGLEDWVFTRMLVKAGVKGIQIQDVVYKYTPNPNGRAAFCQRNWELMQRLVEQCLGDVV